MRRFCCAHLCWPGYFALLAISFFVLFDMLDIDGSKLDKPAAAVVFEGERVVAGGEAKNPAKDASRALLVSSPTPPFACARSCAGPVPDFASPRTARHLRRPRGVHFREPAPRGGGSDPARRPAELALSAKSLALSLVC